jgi:hypothetical protein
VLRRVIDIRLRILYAVPIEAANELIVALAYRSHSERPSGFAVPRSR